MGSPYEPLAGPAPVRLLFIGSKRDDFLRLGSLLKQPQEGPFHLDHAPTLQDSLARLEQSSYDLVLCDYRPGDSTALYAAHELRKNHSTRPVIFLGDHMDQAALTAALESRASNGSFGGAGRALNSASARSLGQAIQSYCQERQRQSADDMLRKLWRAVEQSADFLIITDRAGNIEYVNPSFEAHTGYSREELVGKTPRVLKSGQHPPDFYREMWTTITSGQVFRGIMVNRKKNGETFVAEKTITPLRDSSGEVTHFISNDHDITDRRRLEAQLQQVHKMDAIGRLAGGVAHDFNNLLMVISAYAELMQDMLAPEHPLRRNVHEILKASRSAADLTRQLLGFSRKQMQSLQVLDLNHVLQEISKMLLRLIGEDIELTLVPGPTLGSIRADPVQIEQVVMNLAANARDAMPKGGRLTIETASVRLDESYALRHSIVPVGDYVMMAVTDTGQGISPEHQAHIFEPFFTTKVEGKGTGLGLATVYGIVKQNRGFIWVYSEPGLGTTFKIYLPRAQKGAKPAFLAGKPIEESPPGSETILLVEDEAAVRRSTREFLTLCGYKMLEAKNGEDALRVAQGYSGKIHLMVTDVVMPHMGGAKLAERLLLERPQMKVLFVSGYAESTVLRHGPIDVTNSFLQKPFGLKTLASKVRRVLDVPVSMAAAAASTR
jgi:PAS domain S-box-containing protein